MLDTEKQAHAAVLLAPLPLRQVEAVLDVIDDAHVSAAMLRELARMHCRGESAETQALRRLVTALDTGISIDGKTGLLLQSHELQAARGHAQRVLRGEV